MQLALLCYVSPLLSSLVLLGLDGPTRLVATLPLLWLSSTQIVVVCATLPAAGPSRPAPLALASSCPYFTTQRRAAHALVARSLPTWSE